MRWVLAYPAVPLLLCLFILPALPTRTLCAEDDPNPDKAKNKKDSDSTDNDPSRGFGLSKRTNSKNKDADLTPEQVRENTLKQMREQQAKAQKEQDKWEKKQRSKKATTGDPAAEGDGLGDDMSIFNKNGRRTIELGNDRDSHGTVPPIKYPTNEIPDQRHALEMTGPRNGKSGRDSKVDGSSVELDGNPGDLKSVQDFKRSSGGTDTVGETPHKKGFFERIFGSKKNEDELKAGDKGASVNLGVKPMASELPHTPPGTRDTVVHRVETELARRRLQEELEARKKGGGAEPAGLGAAAAGAAAAAEAKGEVVDLEHEPSGETKAAGSEGPAAPAEAVDVNAVNAKAVIVGVEPKDTAKSAEPSKDDIGPATPADIKAASEYEFMKGLKSKDVVAREAAYQRAAVERREEAIPFLLDEIRKNMLLARYAPQYLAGIGRLTPEVNETLIRGLAGHDDVLRRSCAEALGGMRSRLAVKPLMLALPTEKNYTCRSAYTQALGNIGDRGAIPVLKQSMDDKSEVEFVRCRAALALAQLGDAAGRAYLVTMLDARLPAMQVMGLSGLVQLRDPEVAGYLTSALESPFEEVWVTAVTLLPTLGPGVALPVLRARLESPNEIFRRRAALAMGALGSEDAVPFIDRAVRVGGLQERIMGCELLARLERTDRIPLLIEKLQDAHTLVRQAAAVALAHLNAKQALPALVEAARGKRSSFELPGGIRGAAPDPSEQLTMLSCARSLRGEHGDVYLSTLPNPVDHTWPEIDRVIGDQSVEFLKMYELVDIIPDSSRPVGAVLKTPDGKELLVREGEPVAAGFKVRDMALPTVGKDKAKLPGYVTLMRGEQAIRLIIGKPPEMDTKK